MITLFNIDEFKTDDIELDPSYQLGKKIFKLNGLHDITPEICKDKNTRHFYDAVISTDIFKVIYSFIPSSGNYRREVTLYGHRTMYKLNPKKKNYVWRPNSNECSHRRIYNINEQMERAFSVIMHFRDYVKENNFYNTIVSRSDQDLTRLVQNKGN